jgi:hypothetical protein
LDGFAQEKNMQGTSIPMNEETYKTLVLAEEVDELEKAAQPSVHPTAFGARLRARLANWLFDLSTYLSQGGGG